MKGKGAVVWWRSTEDKVPWPTTITISHHPVIPTCCHRSNLTQIRTDSDLARNHHTQAAQLANRLLHEPVHLVRLVHNVLGWSRPLPTLKSPAQRTRPLPGPSRGPVRTAPRVIAVTCRGERRPCVRPPSPCRFSVQCHGRPCPARTLASPRLNHECGVGPRRPIISIQRFLCLLGSSLALFSRDNPRSSRLDLRHYVTNSQRKTPLLLVISFVTLGKLTSLLKSDIEAAHTENPQRTPCRPDPHGALQQACQLCFVASFVRRRTSGRASWHGQRGHLGPLGHRQ